MQIWVLTMREYNATKFYADSGREYSATTLYAKKALILLLDNVAKHWQLHLCSVS